MISGRNHSFLDENLYLWTSRGSWTKPIEWKSINNRSLSDYLTKKPRGFFLEEHSLENHNKRGNVSKTMGGFIALVFGLFLTPLVNQYTDAAAANSSSTVAGLYHLIPVVWAFALIGGIVALAVSSYKHK